MSPQPDVLEAPGNSHPFSKPPTVIRRIFSFPVTLAFSLAVLALLTVRGRLNDPDFWWHLKTGEIIWTTHAIPRVDVFSYTTHHHAWIPHEWLAQWTLYGSWHAAGYSGIMLWLWLATTLLFVAVYALCALYSGNAKVAFLGGLMVWFFSTVGLAPRPHLLGYLLLTCELLLLHLGRTRNPRWFLALPPLFALWVNVHGSFFMGMAVLAIFLACSLRSFTSELLVNAPWTPRSRHLLWIAAALSVLSLFLNPVGVDQVLYPLNVMLQQPLGVAAVEEWQPPQFSSDPRAMGLLLITGCLLALPLLRRQAWRVEELLLLALAFASALGHSRMLFVFGVLAAPQVCRMFANDWDTYVAAKDRPLPNAVLMLLAGAVLFLAFPSSRDLSQQVDQGNPSRAVAFIRHAGLTGNMLNEYTEGGYLVWALPEHPVFVDGRGDVYEWTGVLREFGAWATLQSDPQALLQKYQVNFCLLSQAAPMAHVFPYLPGWNKVYADERSVIFARQQP